jgi:hypothetical protein
VINREQVRGYTKSEGPLRIDERDAGAQVRFTDGGRQNVLFQFFGDVFHQQNLTGGVTHLGGEALASAYQWPAHFSNAE